MAAVFGSASAESRSGRIGAISLEAKQTGERSVVTRVPTCIVASLLAMPMRPALARQPVQPVSVRAVASSVTRVVGRRSLSAPWMAQSLWAPPAASTRWGAARTASSGTDITR